MKEQITKSQFMDRFRDMDRKDNFSYEGLSALYDYLEDLEDDIGEEIEFDCIALCCEYTEYEDLIEFQEAYNKEEYPNIEAIEQHTTVIKIDDERFIIQDF